MSTRSAARKTDSWKDFPYSDLEGFIVQTVKFANGTTGRGLFVKKQFEAQEFLLSYCGQRRATQVANLNCVMEVQEGKETLFIDSSDETNSVLERFINDKDKSDAANCRMKKVHDDKGRPHCIFLTTRGILSGQCNFSNYRTTWCIFSQNSQVFEIQMILLLSKQNSPNDSQKKLSFEKTGDSVWM